MQISRHWRMNANRYRLEGVRYENGMVSLQERNSGVNGRQEDLATQTASAAPQHVRREKALSAA